MKKGILYTFTILLLSVLFIAGCKKDFTGKKKVTDSTAAVSTFATGLYNYITADSSGNIYALHYNFGADSIFKFDAAGNKTLFYTPPVTMNNDTTVVHTLACLTTDSLGNIYTIDYSGTMVPNVVKITPAGSGSVIFTNIAFPNGQQIQKIAVNQSNFYFCNNNGSGVYKITSGGSITHILTSAATFTINRDGIIYYPIRISDGQASLGQLNTFGTSHTIPGITLGEVVDLTTDEAGHIFTSEFNNDTHIASIRALNIGLTSIHTIIASPLGHVDGPLATAKIGVAFSLITDSKGSLFFSEVTGTPNDIRKITN